MQVIDNIADIDVQQWDALLKSSRTRSIFQSKEYYGFISSLPMIESFVYAVNGDDGILRGLVVGYIQKDGGLLKGYFSRRAIINGGVLLDDSITDEELSALLRALRKGLRKNAIYIETRNLFDYSRYRLVFEDNGFLYEPHLNFHVDTTSEDIVNKKLANSRKRYLKTSFREGAEIVEAHSLEDIREFYAILHDLYINKVKTPLFPILFFEYLYQQDFSKFLLVKLKGKIIGGIVCVCLSDYAVYEWFVCGEDGVYKNIHPSTVATYAGIRYAAQNNYKYFDFMGAGRPDKSYGVREFKSKFGGRLVEHGRFLCVLNGPLFLIGKVGLMMIKKL
ncbi:MAG: peptidoglycan bridge formation glycyltransferase FemA/FemB family protein [Bacteroidales bacterium]|nr:peptidoglycan bridge formation glycyltransferase FemA/FemB family protein [Bacteroidales bacterium]